MKDSSGAFDFVQAVTLAAEGLALTMHGDPASASLFWGGGEEVELVHCTGMPDDISRALTGPDGRHVADGVRRSGQPLRITPEGLGPEVGGLRHALLCHGVGSLATFPLLGEAGIVGCVVVPLKKDADLEELRYPSWGLACRALVRLQFEATVAALDACLNVDRRKSGQLCDGFLVLDRQGRVVVSHRLSRIFPRWGSEDPFGKPLSSLPGGEIIPSVKMDGRGALIWEEHLSPSGVGGAFPVAMAAMPFLPEGGAAGQERIVFLRDLRGDPDDPCGGTANLFDISMRLAHMADEQFMAIERARSDGENTGSSQDLSTGMAATLERADGLVREALSRCAFEETRPSVDLNEVVEEVLSRYQTQMDIERIRVFPFLRPDLPPVPADRQALLRVFRTLVQAARRSLRPGGGNLTARTWAEGGFVYTAISDDGAGLDAGVVESLYEPLFSPDSQRESSDLEIVRGLVESLGGRVQVESRPGVWTRMIIMLPEERRAPDPRDAGLGLPPSVSVRSDERGELQVLVVDDNAALRSVLKRYLERRGHTVTEACDAEEGLSLVKAREFDRLIVDIQMPRRDGSEFYRDLEEVAPRMTERTIFMTGGYFGSDHEEFIKDTGRPMINKPFDLIEMTKTVES